MMSKKRIVFIIIIVVCIVIAVPFALEGFVFRNNVNSVLSNGEWGGFLGSYIGGALGGLGTLLAVYVTTKETREIQKNTLLQIEKDRELNARNERKKFADEVSESIAKYIAEISAYFYDCRALEGLEKDKRNARNELDRINCKIQHLCKTEQQNNDISHIEVEVNELKQKIDMQKHKIENIEKDIAIHRGNRIIANECLFLLQMKLQNIDGNSTILEKLAYIHKNSAGGVDDTPWDWIDVETKELQNITVRFVEKYVDQKLF